MSEIKKSPMFKIQNSGDVKLTNNSTTKDSLLEATNVGDIYADGNIAGEHSQPEPKLKDVGHGLKNFVLAITITVIGSGIVYWLGWN